MQSPSTSSTFNSSLSRLCCHSPEHTWSYWDTDLSIVPTNIQCGYFTLALLPRIPVTTFWFWLISHRHRLRHRQSYLLVEWEQVPQLFLAQSLRAAVAAGVTHCNRRVHPRGKDVAEEVFLPLLLLFPVSLAYNKHSLGYLRNSTETSVARVDG